MYFLQAFAPIALDLAATIAFVAVYWSTGNVVLATLVGVGVGIARFAAIKLRRQAVGPLQYLSIVIVLAAGVTTLITRNPQFVMLKSSLISLAVGVVMLRTNWMAPYLPPIVTENVSARVVGWVSAGWGLLQIALAAANAFVALALGIRIWSWYASIVPTVVTITAFVVNFMVFRTLIRRTIRARHATQATPSAD